MTHHATAQPLHDETGTDYVERECLLFEAGDYPERGLSISPEDLEIIARNTPGEVPVKIEHLSQSPFDGAMGSVGRLRVLGTALWGTLKQPVDTWRFIQRAGARALSIALDVSAKRIVEISFVSTPRVAKAQVFRQNPVLFVIHQLDARMAPAASSGEKEVTQMTVRQLADSLIQYLRGVISTQDEGQSARFAAERNELEKARVLLLHQRAEQQIRDLKQQGLIRAGGEAERLATALLTLPELSTVAFGNEQTSIPELFLRFLRENGPVIPMGEWIPASSKEGGAAEKLITLAQDAARKEKLGYVAAFAKVSAAHPDLARAAREEAFQK